MALIHSNSSISGHEKVLNVLIENGAFVNNRTTLCVTPLALAVNKGQAAPFFSTPIILIFVLFFACNPIRSRTYCTNTTRTRSWCKCARKRWWNTDSYRCGERLMSPILPANKFNRLKCMKIPIWFAGYRMGFETIVKLLLQHGANVHAKTRSDGLSALHLAAANGKHSFTNWWKNLLTLRVHLGQHGIAKLLIDGKADTNVAAVNGETPIFIAARNGKCQTMNQI